jgi:RNA polymerase sigma factor (sigma-70 family)
MPRVRDRETTTDGSTTTSTRREPRLHGAKLATVLERVYKIARMAIRGTLERAEAHEVAQEIVMEYLEQIRAGDYKRPKIGLEAAVRRRATDRAIDHLREAKRRAEREELCGEECLSSGGVWMNPEMALEAERLTTRFDRALGQLPPAYVCALLMVREEGLSYAAAGLRLGITRAGVSQLIVRGQRQLRQALADEGFNVRTDGSGDQGVRDEGAPVEPEKEVAHEEWRVRTAGGLLYDASQYFRRELERRKMEEPE